MSTLTKTIIFLLFFASGVSGLIYEVVWIRMFGLVLGNTTYAISIIIGSFFAGLGLGGFYAGRYIDKVINKSYKDRPSREPKKRGNKIILIYGFLEIGIAAAALIVGVGTSGIEGLLVWLNEYVNYSSTLFNIIRLISSFGLLILPTTLMGATLPVLSKYIIREHKGLRSGLGTLYGINTIGAALGCLITGFFLIETIGVNATIYTAAILNLLIGLISIALERLGVFDIKQTNEQISDTFKQEEKQKTISKSKAKHKTIKSERLTDEKKQTLPNSTILIVIIAFGIAGFTSIAYEITWTRMLSSIFLNSIYSFTTMLTTFLCGLGIGAFVISRFFRHSKNPIMIFGVVEFCIGLSGFLLIILFSLLPKISAKVLSHYSENNSNTTWVSNVYVEFVLSFMVIIIPGILIGMTFPLATQIITTNIRSVGRSIGNIYSINTLGGIFGAIITGCLMIPLLGLKINQTYIASLNIIIGIVLLFITTANKTEQQTTNNILRKVVIPLCTLVAIGVGTFCSIYDIRIWDKNKELLFYNEGSAATVSVVRSKDGNRGLVVNRRYTLGTSVATPLQRRMGYIPLLLHQRPQKVLVIGMGTGITLGAVSSYDLTEKVNCLEIIPAVVKASKRFFANENSMINSKKTHIIAEDGRNYILINKQQYDVIISDLFVPYHAGAGSLYTKEHFDICRERLYDNGLFCQWLPLYQMSDKEFKIICKTFINSFPFTTLWYCNFERGFICGLVGSKKRLNLDPVALKQRIENPKLKSKLMNSIIGSAEELLSLYVTNKKGLEHFTENDIINSNNNPIIEFMAPKHIYEYGKKAAMKNKTKIHPGIHNLSIVTAIKENIATLLKVQYENKLTSNDPNSANPYDFANLSYFSDATKHLAKGMLHLDNNNLIDSEDEFLTAWELAPDYLYMRKMFQDLSVRFYRQENYDETIFINQKLVDAKPEIIDPYLYFYLGLAYQAKGDLDMAISSYQNALPLNPQNKASIHHNLGLIYQSQGLSNKAKQEFEAANNYAGNN